MHFLQVVVAGNRFKHVNLYFEILLGGIRKGTEDKKKIFGPFEWFQKNYVVYKPCL